MPDCIFRLELTSRNHSYAQVLVVRHLPLAAMRDKPNMLPSPSLYLALSRKDPRLLFRLRSLSVQYLARHHPRSSIQSQARSILPVVEMQETVERTFRCYDLVVVDREDVEKPLVSEGVVRGRVFVLVKRLGRAQSWPLCWFVGFLGAERW